MSKIIDTGAVRIAETFRYRKDLPRKGWVLTDTLDHGAADFTCENCGYPHVRYKHHLKNERMRKEVVVGCVCAEHLTQDFTTPRLRERTLKGRAGRRLRWPTLNWVYSAKGNLRLKKKGMIFVLKRGRLGGWAVSYLPHEGAEWVQIPGWRNNPDDAKLAAFDAVY
jgi:hypothetical protein